MKKINFISTKTLATLLCSLCFIQMSVAQTILSFKSSVQYGTQENNLSVVISTDFNGDYAMENVKAASWTDITKEFNLASDKESVEAGKVDISKWTKPGQPVYIAFKYLGQKSSKPTQRSWGISDVSVDGKNIPIRTFTIVNAADNHEGATWVQSSTWMRFRSNLSKIQSESWAIVHFIPSNE